MLDTLRHVETPEGLALNLRSAGVAPRAYAWLLDFGLRLGVIVGLGAVFGLMGKAGSGLMLMSMFVIYWGYPILFEVLRDGQTLGKRVMGLRVINDNGTPITWVPSIVRNLLRTVDMLPFGYGFGLLSGLLDGNGRRLGDLAAGTLVVYAERDAPRLPAPPAAAVAPPFALRQEEQGAIVAFAERSPQMTFERQAELAELLEPVTGSRGGASVPSVLGLANYLLGRR